MSEFKVVLALQASDLGWIEWWMVAALAVSGFALLLASINLAAFRPAPAPEAAEGAWTVTVCIPCLLYTSPSPRD